MYPIDKYLTTKCSLCWRNYLTRNIWLLDKHTAGVLNRRSFLRPVSTSYDSVSTQNKSSHFSRLQFYRRANSSSDQLHMYGFSCSRSFSTSLRLHEDSKVEQQLEILKEKEKDKEKSTETSVQSTVTSLVHPADQRKLKSLWAKVRREIKHYYTGFKLFFLELRISVSFLRKISNGDALTRRERKQLLRTVSDIFRLVPFLIFIIIPFMEFLLPVALKLFPGMLPSTFEEKSKKELLAKQRFKLKLDMARFLQDTVGQMAVKSDTSTSETAQRFSEFMHQVREGGQEVSNEDILKFAKAFRDSLTMDNLQRQQLTALCKILNMRPIGDTYLLRFQIKLRMRKIRNEDLMIKQEGNISSLDVSDLQNLVRDRGMRAYGVSKQKLIKQLEEWLELHLNDKVPLSLLLLSRTLYIPPSELGADPTPAEQLKATISSLPAEASDTAKLRLEELESGEIDNQARLDKVKREQMAIAAEAAEKKRSLKEAEELALKAKEEQHERVLDTALHDFPPGYETSSNTAEQVSKKSGKVLAPVIEQAIEVPPHVIKAVEEALTDLAESKSKVSEERDDLNELAKEIHDYNTSLSETMAASENKVKVRRGSRLLSRYLQYSLKKMQPVVEKIEKEQKKTEEKIEELSQAKKEALDEQTVSIIESKIETHEGTVATIEEVVSAIKALSETQMTDDEMMSEIVKIIDPDQDGIVDIDTVVKAIEFLSLYSAEKVSADTLKELIDVLSKEVEMKNKMTQNVSQEPAQSEGSAASKSE